MALRRKNAMIAFLMTVLLLSVSGCGSSAIYPQTTFDPVTEFGRLVNHLFANTFWWTMIVLVLTEAALIYIVFRYREKPGAPEPKHIHGHTGIEIAWTIIPSIIVLFLLVPTVKGIFATQATPPKDALVVEVIGHQWWWEFRYPEYGVVTANELVLPTGRPVDLQLHSADVIHSYWVPRVGGKRDVNPQPATVKAERARINHIQFNIEQAGYYSGQCAEFCGASHALMRTAIVAMAPGDFAGWVSTMDGQIPITHVSSNAPMGAGTAEKVPTNGEPGTKEGGANGAPTDTLTVADNMNHPAAMPTSRAQVNAMAPTGAPAPGRGVAQDMGPTPPGSEQQLAMNPGQETLEQEGAKLFTTRVCVACHTIRGTTAKGMIGPNLSRFGMRRGVGAGALKSTQENVEKWIHQPKAVKAGALMPGAEEGAGGMPATGLNAHEIKAIAAYLKSLK